MCVVVRITTGRSPLVNRGEDTGNSNPKKAATGK